MCMKFSVLKMKSFVRHRAILVVGMLGLCLTASFSAAQQPTATISSLQEEVFLSFQGGTPISGIAGTVLRAGDSVRTYSGAAMLLSLSDGSKLDLGQNTNLTLSLMEKDPSRVRLDLQWGRVRSILSPVYQTEGSSFSVQTPNALVDVKSSELDAEVLYDPEIQTTTVLAHEFDLRIINLLTGVELQIPRGHSGIIHDGVIQEVAKIIAPPSLTGLEQQRAVIETLSGEVLVSLQGKSITPGTEGLVLRTGDTVRTNAGATAVLTFSDDTRLILGEKSHVHLYSLTEDTQSGERSSRLEILRGTLRAVLGNGYQAPGSSFTLQSANVEVVMENTEEADVEFQYEPNTSVTTILAHKSDLLITHLLTEVSTVIPSGHSGIIYNHVIQEVARILPSQLAPAAAPAENGEAETGPGDAEASKENE